MYIRNSTAKHPAPSITPPAAQTSEHRGLKAATLYQPLRKANEEPLTANTIRYICAFPAYPGIPTAAESGEFLAEIHKEKGAPWKKRDMHGFQQQTQVGVLPKYQDSAFRLS